jgi:flagellar biosynthesis/type III secretory pathway protein FliH
MSITLNHHEFKTLEELEDEVKREYEYKTESSLTWNSKDIQCLIGKIKEQDVEIIHKDNQFLIQLEKVRKLETKIAELQASIEEKYKTGWREGYSEGLSDNMYK